MVGVGAVSGGTGGAGPTDATMRAAASKFEAMAIGELLKPIFDTVDNSAGPFGGGAAERQWMPMLVDAIAERMVKAGGLGLSAPVQQALQRVQQQYGAQQ